MNNMAERQGFEPWEGINPRWFSRPVLSATQPPLQYSTYYIYHDIHIVINKIATIYALEGHI